jgi:hypothetical protein
VRPHEPPLEEMRGKEPATEQRCQRDQCSGNYAEGGGALIQPPRRPPQRENEAAEACDGEKPMQRRELPRWRRGPIGPAIRMTGHCSSSGLVDREG